MGHSLMISSGSILETYVYEQEITPILSFRKKRNPFRRISKDRRLDNVVRLKRVFERLVFSNCLRQCKALLFTFTFVGIMDISGGYRSFHSFTKRLRRLYGSDFRYIAVPEFQKRGSIHFHVLIWGLPDRLLKDERSTRSIQRLWGYGYVDIVQTDGSPKLARYLSKYLFKLLQDDRLFHQKAFVCSRNVLRPVRLAFKSAFALSSYIFDLELSTPPSFQRVYNNKWLGRCNYSFYKI